MDGHCKLNITATSLLPTNHGEFTVYSFRGNEVNNHGEPHLALVTDLSGGLIPLVRIHSECITGDVFRSLRCDCGNQLDKSLELIANHGAGALIYLRQEGRGIGIENKLKAYRLQERGLDTIEANEHLGLPADNRNYSAAVSILNYLGISQCKLMTGNPMKIAALENKGIIVKEVIPLHQPNDHFFCKAYLETKRVKMGHLA